MKPPPVVIYTHEDRTRQLAATIRNWNAANIQITHVEHQTDTPSPARNRRNALAAMRHAMKHHHRGNGLLMIEDDTTPNRHMRAWLEHIETQNYPGPVTLYTPNQTTRYAPDHLKGIMSGYDKTTTGEIFQANTPRGWWGAQAVWIPWSICNIIAADARYTTEELGIGPWDTALRTILIERDLPLFMTAPSIVQHAAGANLVAPHRQRHASASYDWNVTPPTRPRRQPAEEKEQCHKASLD